MYYVYILKCQNDYLYTGITTDITRRFSEHSEGSRLGAKFTKSHRPMCVEALFEAQNRSDASKVECFIKSLSRPQKEEVVSRPQTLVEMIRETKGVEINISDYEKDKV